MSNVRPAQMAEQLTCYGMYEKNMNPFNTKTIQLKPQDFEEARLKEFYSARKRKLSLI